MAARLPGDVAVQLRVPYEAGADSVMYRQVLAGLAEARGWRVHLYAAKDVEARAAGVLAGRADEVLHGPRASPGPLDEGSPRRARRNCPRTGGHLGRHASAVNDPRLPTVPVHVIDDIAYGLMLVLDRAWRDRPRRARRLARRFAEGRAVTVPAWVGPRMDEPAVPGRVHLSPGSPAAEWRPLDRRWNARILVLRQGLGPATIHDSAHGDHPFAHAWKVRDATDTAAFLFIDKPYGAEFASVLRGGRR